MTGQGGGYGDESHDHTPPFARPAEPQPWQQYPYAPVDPQAPVNYPEYPYPPQPLPPPPYGPSGYGGAPTGYGGPPPYGGPIGYGGPPPMYPSPYDPYLAYQANPHRTNSLAVASLITSLAGVVLGIPLAFFCYVGLLIPVVGAVLGGIAYNQIKQTGQEGRGMALAGIVIGSATAAVILLVVVVVAAAAFHSPMFVR